MVCWRPCGRSIGTTSTKRGKAVPWPSWHPPFSARPCPQPMVRVSMCLFLTSPYSTCRVHTASVKGEGMMWIYGTLCLCELAALWRAVADFCELLCSLWFFSGDIWLRSASIGFLPILALLRYWTADIWVLWQWCYGTAFKPVVDMQFRGLCEEMWCFETFLLVLNVDMMSQLWL